MNKPSMCVAEYDKSIKNYTKFDDWYLWVQMHKGTVSMPVFQSLEAFWPGLQVRDDSLPYMSAIHYRVYLFRVHLVYKSSINHMDILNSSGTNSYICCSVLFILKSEFNR